MDSKWIFGIAGLLLGGYIVKKRMAKKSIADGEAMADSAVNEATQIFDDLLAKAEAAGMSVANFRKMLNQA